MPLAPDYGALNPFLMATPSPISYSYYSCYVPRPEWLRDLLRAILQVGQRTRIRILVILSAYMQCHGLCVSLSLYKELVSPVTYNLLEGREHILLILVSSTLSTRHT